MFILIPYHFVMSARRELEVGDCGPVQELLAGAPGGAPPAGAIYLKVWWLGLLLVCAAVMSPVMLAHLFENLKAGPHMNLFMQLVEWRVIVYLALALEGLLWYQGRLNEVRRLMPRARVLTTSQAGGAGVPAPSMKKEYSPRPADRKRQPDSVLEIGNVLVGA